MKIKKFLSSVTAAVCFASTFAVMPQIAGMQTIATEAVRNDFEVTYEGWHGSDIDSSVEAMDGIGFDNSRGMLVSERTSSDAGAVSSKGFYLWGGVKYDYSVKVKSETDEVFHISLLYKDEETEEATTVELATKSVKAGEWTEISASYKAPENTYEYEITITTESTNDFVFDDVLITSKEGKTIEAKAASGGLKDAFKGYGFRVGNILNGGTIRNSTITASFLKDYDAVECENETKPDATLVQNGAANNDIKVSLNSCAAIADFAEKNGLAFRGHTLVWHSQTPEWFFKDNFQNGGNWVSSSVMDQRLESYIKNMFSAFASQYPSLNLYSYDVCNECISDDSNRTANNGGAREPGYGNGKSPWVQVYGSNAFIEKAFTYARTYAPKDCKLFYNDYNEYWDHKRDSIINTILKPLSAKGVLDGMGMQSHIDAGYNTFSGTVNYLKAMDMFLELGLEVHVSEIDVSLDNGQTLNDQADKYEAIFKHAMEVNTKGTYPGRVTLIQVWGPNDANTWIEGDKSPTLYDKNHQPKAAYNKLMALGDGNGPLEGFGGGGEVEPPKPNDYGWYFQCGFEDGTQSWSDRGGNKIAQSNAEHYTEYGNNSLLVSDRTSAWQGAAYSLDSRAFKAGETYSFSAHVKQNTESAVKFMMKIEYTDASGETAYDEVASVTAPKGKWAQLINTEYTIPSGASGVKIYIETEDSLTDFYVDEVIGAVGGTGIAGEGQPTVPNNPINPGTTPSGKVVSGDLNSDNRVDIFDMIAMRKLIVNDFADAPASADTNGDGEFSVADAVALQQYLLGQIKELKSNVTVTPSTKAMRTMSEYTPIVQANVVEFETNDSKQEKAGVQYGTVKSGTYYSTTCNRNKPYNILLPANYSENKQYPVLYVMHGYWENQDRMIIKGNDTMYTRQIIGNAIASGEAEDMIVVFPYIYSSATQDACSAMDDANNAAYDNFINDLTKDLMPHIESTYSVKTGRENTAITGFSMGGREALLIGMQRSDLFGYVGAMCPAPGVTGSFKWNSEQEAPSLLFITAGSNDTVVYDNPKNYHENFANNNVPHIWHYVNGGYHGDNSIHAHIYNFVRAVFKA